MTTHDRVTASRGLGESVEEIAVLTARDAVPDLD